MGFRFRQSVRILPGVRLNLGRRGASVSLGGRGFRYNIGPKGTRVTASLPGTGMSWTQYTPYGSTAPPASPVPLASSYDPPLAPIESAPAETLNALSVSQLAPILSAAQQRFRFLPLVCISSIALLGLSFNLGNQLLVSVTTAFGAVFTVLAVFVDRCRRSVRITYELESDVAAVC